MEIKTTLTNRKGEVLNVLYRDIDAEVEIGDRKVKDVHAYCFYNEKLVIAFHARNGYWTLPGGQIEPGEIIEAAVTREVLEETNMRILKQRLIGLQDIYEPRGVTSQTRSACLVEPIGPFISDPDGDITEIKLIDPKDLKTHVDWGEIGDHLMARALELIIKI